MSAIQKARAVGGLLVLMELLVLFILNFLFPEHTLTDRTIIVLIMLIGALLGLDTLLEAAPVNIKIGEE